MVRPSNRGIQTVERPPGWKPNLKGVGSLSEFLREIVFDKEPGAGDEQEPDMMLTRIGDLKISSVTLRKISLRDQREAKRYRPRPPEVEVEDGRSQIIDPTPTGDPIKTGDLCEHCGKITISRLTTAASSDSKVVSDDLGGHHRSPHDLEVSALICPLCRLFVIAFGAGFRALKKIASLPPIAPYWGQCRFKIWARNTDLDHELKEDEDLKLLVLEWIDGKSKCLAELLLLADKGKRRSCQRISSVQSL
jgi:hypothetical protein